MKRHGFGRILVATDGSRQAHAATAAAGSLALVSNAEVRVVHVWSLEVHHREGVWDVETHREAEALIVEAVKGLRSLGVEASGETIRSDQRRVAAAIAEAARDFQADIVVVGSRGLSDWQSLLHHSVSHQLLQAVQLPLLIVRSVEAPAVHRAQTVLVAVAGGDDVEQAVRAAIATASAPGSKVIVLHVELAVMGAQGFAFVETEEEIKETVARATAMLDAARVANEAVVVEPAGVARVIAETAAREGADLIVVGSSRMGDVASMLFGSVTHQLLQTALTPILVAGRPPR